jgi:Fur family ferric uptake transcriptional regulator
MEDLATISERRLRAAGKRITPQRKLVLDILARASGHLNAGDIYDRGRRKDTSLSLSTVYRTLSTLKETGVVRELHLDDEQHHYELDAKDDHSHLVCLACGHVIEVEAAALTEMAAALGERHGFEIASAQIELTGYCVHCRQQDGGRP